MKSSRLATLLREARIRQGLSQGDVARALGYGTPQYISNWERGLAVPSSKIICKLATLYRVSAEELYETLLKEVLERTERGLREEFLEARRGPRRAGSAR